MFPRVLLKENAKINFKKNYWMCVLVSLIASIVGGGVKIGQNITEGISGSSNSDSELTLFAVVIMLIGILLALALNFFVLNILDIGIKRFFVDNQTENPQLSILGMGFSGGDYMNIVKVLALRDVKVWLWSLLFIIPGIVKSYEYMMVPYILAENPGMDSTDAFALSKQMMDGKKMDAFILYLSFTGWIILSIFTCGILAIFYVNPYIDATSAELYAYNKSEAYQNGIIR